ncbi:LysR substrate-binding domain-containing protein, partial [Kineococcus glutinatus]|uniref:LysR substrate-binding domain-containing protein n=1 Tax=Kineococcus glutinatus TaxID=1070872 RepID=UPI0031EF2FBA
LLPHALAELAAASAGRRAVDDVAGLLRGEVRAGMVTGCALPGFFDAIAEFSAEHPGVRTGLREGTSADLVEAVREGFLDLAVVGAHGEPAPGLGSLVLVDEPLIALRRRDADPPAVLALAELCAGPLVTLPVGAGIRAALDAACAGLGPQPRPAFEASTPEVVAGLAARGLGTAVLSASMSGVHPDLVRVDLVPAPTARLEVVWREPPPGPAVRRLLRHVRAHLG